MNGRSSRTHGVFNNNQADTSNNSDGRRRQNRNSAQWEQPTALLSDFQTRFEAISNACAEVASGFQHLREAIDSMQGAPPLNLGSLIDEVLGFTPRPRPPAPQAPTPPSLNQVSVQASPFSSFANPDRRSSIVNSVRSNSDSGASPGYGPHSVVKVEDDVRENPNSPSATSSPHSQEHEGGVWSDEERRTLNDEFIRYFERRKASTPITHKTVADELLGMCTSPPPLNHLDRQVGRYLRRHTMPKDPIVLAAIQEWIEVEIRENGQL